MAATKILTSDILIVDRIIDYDNLEPAHKDTVDECMKAYGMQLEGKCTLSKEQFDQFTAVLNKITEDKDKIITNDVPGGSAANTVTSLSKLLGSNLVDATFIGITSNHNNPHGEMIRKGLSEAGVKLVEPHGDDHESAISFVVVKDGKRAIATYPGNARDKLKSSMITDELAQNCDAIFIQGSLEYKCGNTIPNPYGYAVGDQLGFADTLLKKRRENNKELWLALPTQADFSKGLKDVAGNVIVTTSAQRAARFRKLIESANVVMGNGEELCRVYEVKDIKNIDEALAQLQTTFREKPLENIATNEDWHLDNTNQVAFITLGEHGSAIVTKDTIQKIPAATIDEKDIVNTLGAGDTSYAGFLAGYILQKENPAITNEDCARLGMWLAREKLKVNGARISEPYGAISEALSGGVQLGGESDFVSKMEKILAISPEQPGAYITWANREDQKLAYRRGKNSGVESIPHPFY